MIPLCNWWEKELDDRRFALHATNGDLTTSNTTLTLAAGENAKTLKNGDVLYVEESGERLLVIADPTSNTSIYVQRGFAGTTPTALDANGSGVNPNLLYMGSAYEEGSLPPTGVSYDPTKRINMTGIFRDTLEATRTAIKTRLRTGDAIKEAKRECLEYHGVGIERSFWLGKQFDTTRNGKPFHGGHGFLAWMSAYASNRIVSATAAGVDLEEFEGYMLEIFRYGSSEKVCICGNRALLAIQQLVRKNAQYQFMGDKEFGMNVTRMHSPFGSLIFKTHPQWNQITSGVNTAQYYAMDTWMAVLDMEQFTYVYLKDSDTKYEPSLQANGMDGMQSGYITECALEIHHPKTHYLIKGMFRGAADN